MKKIYINETSLGNIKEYGLLPDFLFKMVKGHKTSLGDNEAFPKIGEYPFDYSIIKKRFEDVSFHIKSTLNEFDEDSLMSELSSLVTECKGLEEPIKDSLEKLAENAINRLFAIPSGTINFTFKLVGKVEFKNSPRITPESDENLKYSFKDIADIDHSNKAVEKRRFINALIQGGARRMLEVALSSDEVAFADLGKLNPHLITLYKKILYINDYLLFIKPEKLDDKRPMQGSYVETHLGSDGNRSTIDAQGIIFPLLLQEAIKGIFELFSSHGLPSDRSKAMYVIKKADYILAEPWDMRFGPTLWDMIFGGIEDSNIIPYAFTNLIKLPTDEFNLSVREILADTEAGKEIINGIVNDSQYDSDYQEFTNRINARNMDKSVIADSYFTAAELDGLDIDSEESNVIEESEDGNVDYIKLIENATVDNIDFEEGRTIAGNGEELILTIKGVEIPQLLVSLVVYLVGIDVEGKPARVLNLHIILGKEIQGMGLGTKIYTKMVYEFGSLYSWDATRSNKEHIGKIFKRLDSDPNIEVTTIPGKEGGVDYLAVLKGHNIFESAEKDKALITEGWGKDKKRIIDRCAKLIKDGNPTITTSKAYELEKKIEDTYFHEYGMSSSLKIRKFEPMIVKILVEELGYPDCPTTSEKQNFLKSVTKCIWNHEVKQGKTPMANGSFENNNPDNFETLYAKYKPFMEEIEARGMSLNGKQNVENDYKIIPIPDYETAHKWGNWSFPGNDREYGKLCYTTGEGTWDSWIEGGRNSCFLCLNEKTYQNYPINTYPEDDEKTPYDEYGLSMIWVFVDQNGNLVHSNTRWNHHRQERIPTMPYGGKGVDESFSQTALENILDKPFDEAFNAQNSFKYLTEEANKIIDGINEANGVENYIDEIFDDDDWGISWLIGGKILEIRNFKAHRSNLVKNENGRWELVFPNIWFDSIDSDDSFEEIKFKVKINNLYNLLDSNFNFVLPNNLWCDKISKFFTNISGKEVNGYIIGKNGLNNIFVPGSGLVFNDFVNKTGGANGQIRYTLNRDGSITLYPPDGGSPVSLNEVIENYRQGIELPYYIDELIKFDYPIIHFHGLGGVDNIIDKSTGNLLNYWAKSIYDVGYGYYMINFDDAHVNIINKNGDLLIKKEPLDWPSGVHMREDKYFVIEGRENYNRENICDFNGNFLFDINDENSWVTDIKVLKSNLIEGQNYLIILFDFQYDKYNIADENLDILWKQPKDKWFDAIKTVNINKTGFVPVRIGEKWNYFSIWDTFLLYKKPVEEWFDFAEPFIEGSLLAAVGVGDNYYNFIDVNGDLLFEHSTIALLDTYDEEKVVVVRDTNMNENIVDLELGNVVSDEWFKQVSINAYNRFIFNCYKNDGTYFYDSKRGMFIENKLKYAQHDFSDYTDGLKEYLEKIGIVIKEELIPNKLYSVEDRDLEGAKRNLVGIINGKAKYLLPEWCKNIGLLHGNAIGCRINNYCENIFDVSKLRYAFDEPMESVEYEDGSDCFIVTNYDGTEMNFVDNNCNVLLKEWPNEIYFSFRGDDGNYYYEVAYMEKGKNIFCPVKNGFLMKKYYDSLAVYSQKLIFVGVTTNDNGTMWNLLGKDGEPVLDRWAIKIDFTKNGNALLTYREEDDGVSCNIYDVNTCEFMSDEPLEIIQHNNNPIIYKLVKNGKYNYIKSTYNPKPLLPNWADNVINNFEDGKYGLVEINGEEYTLVNNNNTRLILIFKGDVYGLGGNGSGIRNSFVQAVKNAKTYKNTTDRYNYRDEIIEGGEARLSYSILVQNDSGGRINASYVGYAINDNNIAEEIYAKNEVGNTISFNHVSPQLHDYYLKKFIENIN